MPRGSRRRALLVGIGAFVLFGGWALFANREHATAAMIRAALAQGSFSFCSSTLSVLLLEYLYGIGRTPAQQVVLGAVGTPAIILLAMTGGHLIARTPNLVATLLPSWISGLVFCIVYTINVRRIARAAQNQS
jgi:hypothetical protein